MCIIIVFQANNLSAQGVAINEDGSNANSSAMLDVKATDKGVLIPRVDIANLSSAAPIASPADGLLVYNINTTTGQGYYYWNGSEWVQLTTFDDERPPKWSGTSSTSSDIGRTGQVGLGTTSPQSQFHITEDMQIGTDGFNRDHMMTFWAENGYEANLVMRETPDHGMGIRYNATDNKLYFDRYPDATIPSPIMTLLRDDEYIGIGTTAPTSLLHVDGSVRFSNLGSGTQSTGLMIDGNGNLSSRNLNISNWDDAYNWGDHATEGYLTNFDEMDPTWNGSANETADIGRSGNVGIGTTNPNYELDVLGDDLSVARFRRTTTGGTSGGFQFGNSDQTYEVFGNDSRAALRVNGDYVMYWGTNGNIGIGTTSPTSLLHVDGSVRFSNLGSGTQSTGLMIDGNGNLSSRNLNISNWDDAYNWGDHATEGYLTNFDEMDPTWNGSANETADIGRSGNVGIGTTSPGAKLDIKDHTDSGIMLYLTDDNTSTGDLAHKAIQVQTQGTVQSWLSTNGHAYFRGDVGIGTSNPSQKVTIINDEPFTLSGNDTGVDNLYLEDHSMGAGDGNIGGSLSFSGPYNGGSGNQRRHAAIAGVQETSESDYIGLAFYTHNQTVSTYDMQESMRLTHDGKLGIGTNSPTQDLEVEGISLFNGGTSETRIIYDGYIEGETISDGNRLYGMPSDETTGVGWGYIGDSDTYWYYVYSQNLIDPSRRELKRDIISVTEREDLASYIMNDIDKMKPSFYKYKNETDQLIQGQETKYRPNQHLGLLVDEAPDYIKDNELSGIDIYALSTLTLLGVQQNRKDIKEIHREKQSYVSSGTGVIRDNKVKIAFDDSFKEKIKEDIIPVVVATPVGKDVNLYIVEISSNGFTLGCDSSDPVSFQWMANISIDNNKSIDNNISPPIDGLKVSKSDVYPVANMSRKNNNDKK
ncbi:MAG: hypothetical protein ACLFM1_04910 [Bacteroidales bacterium]